MMSAKIKTIIIEDNPKAQEYLGSILEKNFNDLEIMGFADTIQKSVKLIQEAQPELVFMDIELLDGPSFEIFSKITFHEFEVIFVTAFDEFMRKAMDHYAFSYIIKPIQEVDIITAVNRYLELKQRLFSKGKQELLSRFIDVEDSRFLLHVGNEHISISVSEIVKCTAEGNYTKFIMSDKKEYLASNNLKYYDNLLSFKGFFKAHRSVLINSLYIKSVYKKETIILQNNDKINVSVRNRSRLVELLNTLS